MSKYRAIVFDLDGTAVPNERGGLPSPRVIEAVAQAKHKIHLIAATGRPINVALPILDTLGVIAPSVVSGGAVILEAGTHRVIKQTTIPKSAVHAIFEITRGLPYPLYLTDEIIDKTTAKLHASLAENVEIIYLASIPTAKTPAIIDKISRIPDIMVSAVPDWLHQGLSLNITHKNATKEHAVAEVLASLGVPASAAIGIGDGDNDIHLFRSVDLKVAMGNASANLKAAADIITKPVDEDGLAEIIERYAV